MVLEVKDGEEEGHYSAELQINWFNRVVVFFEVAAQRKNPHVLNDDGSQCQKWSDGAVLATIHCFQEASYKAADEPSRNPYANPEQSFAFRFDLLTEYCLDDQPG